MASLKFALCIVRNILVDATPAEFCLTTIPLSINSASMYTAIIDATNEVPYTVFFSSWFQMRMHGGCY